VAERLGVAIVGCGLIGCRRAKVAAAHAKTRCVVLADVRPDALEPVATEVGAEATTDWRAAVHHPEVDLVVVATPNALLAEVAIEALQAGKDVLIEKPMGRSLAEAEAMGAVAKAAGRTLKVGFNHRYHPAIAQAYQRTQDGEIGALINLRCRYGHGGRPGYEREWRGSREQAGGGELTDQGVHVIDLLQWLAGEPTEAYAVLQTAVWPLGDLEDNAFAVLRFPGAVVASFHTSWTQWKNLFSLEVFGERGALLVDGLGRRYGRETLTRHIRRAEGGAPETMVWEFPEDDPSWTLEWDDFLGAALEGRPMWGTVEDGVAVMRTLDALYRSVASGAPVELGESGRVLSAAC
jgi:predicted dehydrogenase